MTVNQLLSNIVSLGVTDDCDELTQTTRRVFTGSALFVGVMAPLWGAMYITFGELGPGLIPSAYSAITLVSFLALWRFGGWHWFRISQIFLIFVLPIALMLSLGGYVLGSTVIIWAILAPLGSLWGGRSREAVFWVVAFLFCAILSGLLDPFLRDSNNLPDTLRMALFVMNMTFVMGVVFWLLAFFVNQKDALIDVMQRNRALESAYLEQELSLRQSEKLATLGKLSAGLAHELNNPTAAAQQATQQLTGLLLDERWLKTEIAGLDLSEGELQALDPYIDGISERIRKPEFLDPIDRSDREYEMQEYLESAGVDEPWDIAPSVVGLGLSLSDIKLLASRLRPNRFSATVTTLARHFRWQSLLGSLDESTNRIIEMIGALKSYSYMDQAPRQLIDVHAGIDSTLVMLQNRMKIGIEIRRAYADDLPQIEAYGGELNQVWTNILDNAIDAMDGEGVIDIATRRNGDRIVIEISNNGPGIPAEIAGHIFDPFVTTKAPGQGTGLGLNISHNIVTQKHGGEISMVSESGATTFTVVLPITGPPTKGEGSDSKDYTPVDRMPGKE
jgi:signal transduction histidine kinase